MSFNGRFEDPFLFPIQRDPLTELSRFTYDLTAAAEDGLLDPLIGREKELDRMIRVLCRRTKNNPVIIGEPGVGKTALIEGLAQRIVDEEVPDQLLDCSVISVDLGAVIAGTRYRGEFEERLQILVEYSQKIPGTILFIDEIHTLIGAGSAEGTMDAANMLKPILSRGRLKFVGATTIKEYRKYIERDPALERRFQPIVVEPPTVPACIRILARLRRSFESFHGVFISNQALVDAIELSERYITDRYLPDKAIDVIDEACTLVMMRTIKYPPGILPFYDKLVSLEEEKEELIRMNDLYSAARLVEEEDKLLSAIERYQLFYLDLTEEENRVLRRDRSLLSKFIPICNDRYKVRRLAKKIVWAEKKKQEEELKRKEKEEKDVANEKDNDPFNEKYIASDNLESKKDSHLINEEDYEDDDIFNEEDEENFIDDEDILTDDEDDTDILVDIFAAKENDLSSSLKKKK